MTETISADSPSNISPKGVLVGIPFYGRVPPATVISLVDLLFGGSTLLRGVIPFAGMYVDRARNSIAKTALQHPPESATHLLYLDADNTWPYNTIERLLSHNKEVVGGLYFGREQPHDIVAGDWIHSEECREADTKGYSPEYRPLARIKKGLTRVGVMGMGCCLVALETLRKMKAHFGDEEWFRCWGQRGEDLWFFNRLRLMGVPCYLDNDLKCGHITGTEITEKNWYAARGIHTQTENSVDPNSPEAGPPDFADVYEEAINRLPYNRESVVVEVGCYLGRSAVYMAQLIRDSGKKVSLYCFDKFQGSDDDPCDGGAGKVQRALAQKCGGTFYHLFCENLSKRGFGDTKVYRTDSSEGASVFANRSVDFCFIDADHTEEKVIKDIRAWLPKIRPGGVIAGHDFNWPGVCKAVLKTLPMDEVKTKGYCWWYEVC